MEEPEFISIPEAARKLGVTTLHFRRMLDNGRFPTINVAEGKIRKSLRVRRTDIEEFINQGGIQ